MADADRDSDLGDDSPVSARSEGESSGDQSCESSDEGVGRDAPAQPIQNHQTQQHQPLQPLQPHQAHQSHQPHQPHQSHQSHQVHITHPSHHAAVNHQLLNNHQMNHKRNSPRPLDRDIKVRDDFEALKSSLHPHLSSLASLAQGAPLSAPSNVFALPGAVGNGGFSYAPPPFLAPAPPPPAQPAGSASSSSSEGSSAGWSFDEQYKQVRQLYEISDDPGRKEFLDDLFTFMQKRGTPINRLPIMAKSVLDLYELYNLVIARGGLVEVINKKLWQEIIKGLRLPSSITSAAFTLRTQYMKYLYDYECEKKNLSTRTELDAAIEGNKREGRRSSGQYEAQAALAMPPMNRGVPVSLAQLSQHMPPLALPLAGGVAGMPRLPAMPPHAPHEFEYRLREYMKMFNQHRENMLRNVMGNPDIAQLQRELQAQSAAEIRPDGRPSFLGPESPPTVNGPAAAISPRDAAALNALDVSRLTLWSLYNNNNNHSPPQPADLEPQCEALNLSESPNSSVASGCKREASRSPLPPPKRSRASSAASPAPRAASPRLEERHNGDVNGDVSGDVSADVSGDTAADDDSEPAQSAHASTSGAAFKITTRGDVRTGDHQLIVSIELNGVTYEGVLHPANGNGQNGRRPVVVNKTEN